MDLSSALLPCTPQISSSIFFFFLFFFNTFPISSLCNDDDQHFTNCSLPFECGSFKKLYYPFSGGTRPDFCGQRDFKLHCLNDEYPILKINDLRFRILSASSNNIITISRLDLLEAPCSPENKNMTLDSNLLNYPSTVENITLTYGCSKPTWTTTIPDVRFLCNSTETVYYSSDSLLESLTPQAFNSCSYSIKVPISKDALESIDGRNERNDLMEALQKGFDVSYNASIVVCEECNRSGGRCGSNSSNRFLCYCQDKPYPFVCGHGEKGLNLVVKAIIAVIAGLIGLVSMGLFCIFYQRKRHDSSLLSRNISSNSYFVKDVEKGTTYHGIHVFTYQELEEATNNFDEAKQLGDGGCGTVYYGKLTDGRAVAVKRLYENNCKRVEQFMNEVVILGRLCHQNLVSLYGCTSCHSRELLLVFEYIPNGTVYDHLQGGQLPWFIRMKIAIETACALTYLHASDIIHRDVKTNNILVDNSFCVKVADFGLSRLFPTHVTHISTAPQGTPGYVDPQYHQCYQLTNKSDVYSFGVVLIELISSKPAVDITRHFREINLSTMAIDKIQNHALHELVDPNLQFESDLVVRKMITAVAELAFRCLQNEKDIRPSMVDVLNELNDIQQHSMLKPKEQDIAVDDVVMLRNDLAPFSPNSESTNGSSNMSRTPNASG